MRMKMKKLSSKRRKKCLKEKEGSSGVPLEGTKEE